MDLPESFLQRFRYCFQLANKFNRETEELVDYYIHRRLAAVLVATMGALDMPWLFTPNRITFVSLCCGMASAWCVAQVPISKDSGWLLWAAVLELLSITFDCCDGQLARLYKSGSLIGRVLDGLCDMVCALSHGFVWTYILIVHYDFPAWPMIFTLAIAIVTFQQQCMLFDRIKNLYVHNTTKEKDEVVGMEEREVICAEVAKVKSSGDYISYLMLLWYEKQYIAVQNKVSNKSVEDSKAQGAKLHPAEYKKKWMSTVRLISWCGTGTHAALFYIVLLAAYVADEPRLLGGFYLLNNIGMSTLWYICLGRVSSM